MSDILRSAVTKSKKPFFIVNDDSILVFEPLCRNKIFIQQVQDLITQGEYAKAMGLLKVLDDPRLFMIRSTMFKAIEKTSIDVLNKKIEMVVKQEILKERGEADNTRLMFLNQVTKLPRSDRMKLIKKRISLWIMPDKIVKKNTSVNTDFWAIFELGDYIVEHKSSDGEGQWRFPRCSLGVPIIFTPPYNLISIENQVFILDPVEYKHPFAKHNMEICMGDFYGSAENEGLRRVTFVDRVIKCFEVGTQILTSGYVENKDIHPAQGHITSASFAEFKINNRISTQYRKILREKGII